MPLKEISWRHLSGILGERRFSPDLLMKRKATGIPKSEMRVYQWEKRQQRTEMKGILQ